MPRPSASSTARLCRRPSSRPIITPAGDGRHGRPRGGRLRRRARPRLHRAARRRHPLGRRGAPGRQHPRRARADARRRARAPPRRGARTSTPDDVKALAVLGALAPADPAPRGRVRRRHAGGRRSARSCWMSRPRVAARPHESDRLPAHPHLRVHRLGGVRRRAAVGDDADDERATRAPARARGRVVDAGVARASARRSPRRRRGAPARCVLPGVLVADRGDAGTRHRHRVRLGGVDGRRRRSPCCWSS